MRIYVAGPLTSSGNLWDNVARALAVADLLLTAGHAPYVPHLNAHWARLHHHEEKVWLSMDLEWLGWAECLVRIRGVSDGAEQECLRAEQLGIPVVSTAPLRTLLTRLASVEKTLGQPMPARVERRRTGKGAWEKIRDHDVERARAK